MFLQGFPQLPWPTDRLRSLWGTWHNINSTVKQRCQSLWAASPLIEQPWKMRKNPSSFFFFLNSPLKAAVEKTTHVLKTSVVCLTYSRANQTTRIDSVAYLGSAPARMGSSEPRSARTENFQSVLESMRRKEIAVTQLDWKRKTRSLLIKSLLFV